MNRFGGDKTAVANAVNEIEATGGAEQYLVAARGHRRNVDAFRTKQTPTGAGAQKQFDSGGLFRMPGPHRLALEMALHEEAERRAVEGELAELERAWRDAEEIAGIADSLLLPESVDASMDKIRRQVGGEA